MSLTFDSNPTIVYKNKPSIVSNKVTKVSLNPTITDYNMELIKHGVTVNNGLQNEGVVEYLLAHTKDGIVFMIHLDLQEYRQGFSLEPLPLQKQDVFETTLKQEVKVGAIKCVEGGVCGAVFIQENSLCVVKKKMTYPDDELRYTEENYTVKESPHNALSGLPLVTMTSIINDPKILNRLGELSEKLTIIYRNRLHSVLDDFENTIGLLERQREGMFCFLDLLYTKLKSEIDSCNILLSTLAPGSEHYNMSLTKVNKLRETQLMALQKIGTLEKYYQEIADISSRISQEIDPVVASVCATVN